VTSEEDLDDLDPGNDELAGQFPLSAADAVKIEQIIALVRQQLARMSPAGLHVAAAVLLALERLPSTTPGVQATFGFSQPNVDGNYAWVDIRIDEEEFHLGVGEHFYTPDVGGDTESRVVFETQSGTRWREGDIDSWLEVASFIAPAGEVTFEDDSAHDELDWSNG
jgi:hypothetical protein